MAGRILKFDRQNNKGRNNLNYEISDLRIKLYYIFKIYEYNGINNLG